MIRAKWGWRSTAVLAVLAFAAQPAHATIDYAVSVAHPERHIFAVTMHIPNVRDRVLLQMPAWDTLYQIRDFAAHLMQVSAKDEANKALAIVKLDKQTWQVTGNGNVTVEYSSYWDEPGPFASQLNPDHAFVNFAMILMYVPDRRGEDTQLVLEDVPQNWRVAVELDSKGSATDGHGATYIAPSYDALVDAPAEVGEFDEFRIEAGSRPIRIVVHGGPYDRAKLADALTRIVTYESSLMGGAPFREYLFLLHVGPNFGGGGMEHSNSTAISADVFNQLPAYSAHEFFHTWNVKRIRPQSLEPVDYTKEMWTRSLWFAEGVTNTYGAYALVRTGLWTTQQFYGDLANQIKTLETSPAHIWQSAEESSLDAWFEKYALYTRPEESISYYNKGQLLGVSLDILIRDATDNRASLDDVMRALNQDYAMRGRFYNESEDIRKVAESVILKYASTEKVDLGEFFSRYVSGTDEIPFAELLGRAGLQLKITNRRQSEVDYQVSENPDATEKQRRIREGMLHGKTN